MTQINDLVVTLRIAGDYTPQKVVDLMSAAFPDAKSIKVNHKPGSKSCKGYRKYDFAQMEVGSSRDILASQDERKLLRHKLYCAAKKWCKNNQPDWEFKVQLTPQGICYWRSK